MKMSALEYISYALFPRRCALCGKVVPPDMPVCDRCEADLEYVKGEIGFAPVTHEIGRAHV